MSLTVLQKGVSSIPVDLGRTHYQHLGVTVGGPMDLHAYLWANHLVGNASRSSQIEICHGHFKGEFNAPCIIAVTGADMTARVNNKVLPRWCSVVVKKGDVLTLAGSESGFYAYLAVAGGFNIEPQLGSVCAVRRDGLGGLNRDGEGLQIGDVLPFYNSATTHSLKRTPPEFIPNYDEPLNLGVIECYQHSLFEKNQRQSIYGQSFKVSPKLNRQGICLQGRPIVYTGRQLVSEGIAFGAIQIPPDGQPIILMRDRQSIGGYPKFGCVSVLDAGKLAQRRPETKVQFKPANLNKSQTELKQLLYFFSSNST